MGDPVLAAEIDTACVHGLHSVPGVRFGLEDRGVVRGRDAGVVVEDVDAAVALRRCCVHGLDARRVCDVHLDGDGVTCVGGGLRGCFFVDVGCADLCPFCGEEQCGFAAHAAAGAGDHGDLAVEPSHQPIATKTFFTSE